MKTRQKMAVMSDPFVASSVLMRANLKVKHKLNVLTVKMAWPNGLRASLYAHLDAPVLLQLKAEISTVLRQGSHKVTSFVLQVIWKLAFHFTKFRLKKVPYDPVLRIDLPGRNASSAVGPDSSSRAIQPFSVKSTRSKSRADSSYRMTKIATQ